MSSLRKDSAVPEWQRLRGINERGLFKDRGEGEWAGKLDNSAWTSEVPGSAYRLFLLENELGPEPVAEAETE